MAFCSASGGRAILIFLNEFTDTPPLNPFSLFIKFRFKMWRVIQNIDILKFTSFMVFHTSCAVIPIFLPELPPSIQINTVFLGAILNFSNSFVGL